MHRDIFKNEEEVEYDVPGYPLVMRMIENLETNTRWFFHSCSADFGNEIYDFFFSSYELPEYQHCQVWIQVTKNNSDYVAKLISHKE